jgi:DNA-directed RNA polymerase beta subunit
MPSIFATPGESPPSATPQLREFGDVPATRQALFDNVLKAAQQIEPASNPRYTLALSNVKYAGPEQFSKADHKRAILSNQSLVRRLRGTWQLSDTASGKPLASKEVTLAHVPWLTDNGTFVYNGSNYVMGNQLRLLPGVFARRKQNGELAAHINVGRGLGHHIHLDPASGVFHAEFGQARIPLFPLLKSLGVTDQQLREHWGNDLTAANMAEDDPQAIRKLYAKLHRYGTDTDDVSRRAAIGKAISQMELDPEVTRRTLGQSHKNVSPEVYLAATKKLLAINKGQAEEDDRDHLAYQRVLGPEDLFAESIQKARGVARKLLWKASAQGNLDRVPVGAYTPAVNDTLLNSGLGQPLEEVSPAEIFDQLTRITRMGRGGIPSLDAIPDSARAVHNSQYGFIDYLRTPESSKVGVDLRLARSALKGSDGKVYTKVRDLQTNQLVTKSPQDLTDTVIAGPGELESGRPFIDAFVNGKARKIPRSQAKFAFPSGEDVFNPLGNMVPMKSTVKGQRSVMAARMLTQALPLTEPEAPLVQSGIPNEKDKSYEHEYGHRLGAVLYRLDGPGRVRSVDDSQIVVEGPQGQRQAIELHRNLPFNRKTFFHQEPVVKAGDTVQPGQLLARSNFTDQHGTAALGKNARVAYIPRGGLNFEDAIVVSKSFAKRMNSEHMYQHGVEWDERMKRGKRAFMAIFPAKYPKQVLQNFDDQGVIKEGSRVEHGAPLVLVAKEREPRKDVVHHSRGSSFQDESLTWDHHSPGFVTDVVHTNKGVQVVVKTAAELQVGDKLCFDPATRLLTRRGWKAVAEIALDDEIATLNPATDCLEYQHPTHLQHYRHDGPMYYLNTKHVNMLVTPNHRLWVAPRGGEYQAVRADTFYASDMRWTFKKDCKWVGAEQAIMDFGEAPRRYTRRTRVLRTVPMDDWLKFLGFYLAEGWCQSPGYVKIGQFRKSPHWQTIADLLTKLGLGWRYDKPTGRFEIGNIWLYELLKPLGNSYTKCVPAWVQGLSQRQLRLFLDAYLAGDGHKGACWEYGSSSERLAVDIQVICLKLGWSVSLKQTSRTDNWQKQPHWRGRINRKHLRPVWQKGREKTYKSNQEAMIDYSGDVYCVTVPNHVVYCKREDKTYWSHNSGRYG